MCLVIFALQTSPDYPLVVAANRDEFHARPTAPSAYWKQHPELLAGRDLEQGGTWMGITRRGRFAAITNYRDPNRTAPAPRSRGQLTLDFLVGETGPGEFLAGLGAGAADYAGFNLLLGDGEELWYLGNGEALEDPHPRRLAPGIYGLSNALLDTPWPKVELGKRRLSQLLEEGEPGHDALAAVVSDRHLASPGELHPPGAEGSMEHLLSAQFINAGPYGTRACTTLWTERGGSTHWLERSYDEQGLEGSRVQECFTIPAAGG